MDKLHAIRQAGATIFRSAAHYITKHNWHHNSMEILLTASGRQRWPQPMAILMYSELEHALSGLTLTEFDAQAKDKQEVIDLFNRVADQLSQTSSRVL